MVADYGPFLGSLFSEPEANQVGNTAFAAEKKLPCFSGTMTKIRFIHSRVVYWNHYLCWLHQLLHRMLESAAWVRLCWDDVILGFYKECVTETSHS